MKIKALLMSLVIPFCGCEIRNKLTFYPDNESEIPKQNIPDFIIEKYIKTTDNENIQAFLFRHNDDLKRSLIIYFHGNAGNLYHRFDHAKKLYDMDHDVMLVSYRGYAKSSGKPNEKGIYIDAESAIDYATDSLGYDKEKITLFGRSLGTTAVINVAQNRLFNGLILVTPLTSGKEMATAMGLGLFKFLAGNSYNSLEKINNIESKILIIHGDKDQLVPYKMGKRLFNDFKGNKHFVTIKRGGHNDLQDVDPILFWGEIKKFLNEH